MSKRSIIALVVVLLLVLGVVGACAALVNPGRGTTSVSETEGEDCDAEDRRNKERECGFVKPTKKPTAKPVVKATKKPRSIFGGSSKSGSSKSSKSSRK